MEDKSSVEYDGAVYFIESTEAIGIRLRALELLGPLGELDFHEAYSVIMEAIDSYIFNHRKGEIVDGCQMFDPISSIQAIGELLQTGWTCRDIDGLENASEIDIYALIGLHLAKRAEKLTELLDFRGLDGARKSVAYAQSIGAITTEAMEFICTAESMAKEYRLSIQEKHQMRIKEIALREKIRQEIARHAAVKRIEKDSSGKQKAKQQVKECWDRWQKNRNEYSGKSAFARAMLDKYEALSSQQVITRWCTAWELELSQQSTYRAG